MLKKIRKDGFTIELEEAEVPALKALLAKFQAGLDGAKQRSPTRRRRPQRQ